MNNGDEWFSLAGRQEWISRRCRVLLGTLNIDTNCAIVSFTNEKNTTQAYSAQLQQLKP